MAEEQKSWYNTGYSPLRKEEDRLSTLGGPNRLWIKPGESKEIVLLDDEPFTIHEHNCKIEDSWRNWFTCLKEVSSEAPCCEILGEKSRYLAGYYSIIDCSEWTDKKGNHYQFEQKFLNAKLKTLKKFRRKKEERGSLIGCLYRATREDSKSPVCGDEFEFVREVDLTKLFGLANYRGKLLKDLWQQANSSQENMDRLKLTFQARTGEDGKLVQELTPFNYFKLLEPLPSKDLRVRLKGASAGDFDDNKKGKRTSGAGAAPGEGGDDGTGADEEVPF